MTSQPSVVCAGPAGQAALSRSLRRPGFVPFPLAALEGSIPDRFEAMVRHDPERLALSFEGTSLSYEALEEASDRVARALSAAPGPVEDPIAVLLSQGARLVITILGVLKAGRAYLALDGSDPPSELARIVEACGPSTMVTISAYLELATSLAGSSDRVLSLDTLDPATPPRTPGPRIPSERSAYVFSTSGSTGPPKSVVDNHRNVLHNVMRYTNSLAIHPDDRLSLIQSASFSGTVSSLFSALLNGAAICPFDLRGRGVGRMAEWIRQERITVFHSVPTIFEQLMQAAPELPSLRLIRLEGDRTLKRHVALFQERFGPGCVLVNGLGATETGLTRQFFLTADAELSADVVPVGYPVPDMTVRVQGEDGTEVGSEEVGEITVGSAYLAPGYRGRPDLTARSFAPDPDDPAQRWYRTGDLGRMSQDGCLEVLGRVGGEVKIRGARVEVASIENALQDVPGVDKALVTVREDRPGIQSLVAYLVCSAARPTVTRIRDAVTQRLPRRMVPARYVFLEELPTDRHGKIDRAALPVPSSERPKTARAYVAARSDLEADIADCMSRVLAVEPIGVHDDFWELGGDSLSAAQLMVDIEDRLGLACPETSFLDTVTVDRIARSLTSGSTAGTLVTLRAEGRGAPLFCVHDWAGRVLQYRALGRLLGAERPVYALQNVEMVRRSGPPPRVEEMAATCIRAIRAVQPDGPYYLCGNCFGGTVAFEIAKQLHVHGHAPALLALIDTAHPGGLFGRIRHRLSVSSNVRRLQGLTWSERLTDVARRLRGLARWGPELVYDPGFYPGPAVLISPGPPDNQLGWRDRVASLEIVELSVERTGEERPYLVSSPYVHALAEVLSERLPRDGA